MAASVASESLKPSPPKNLIPLSANGLWEAEMTAARSKPYCFVEQRRGGRRQDAAEQHVAPGRRDPRGERGLEHRAGLAGVADDEHARAVGLEAGRDGVPEAQGEVGREDFPGGAPDAVGAEQAAGHRGGCA